MSRIIEAMEKAKVQRELTVASSKISSVPRKPISWPILLNVLGMCIVIIIFYLLLNDNHSRELNLIDNKLAQMEYKLAQVVEMQDMITYSIAFPDRAAPQVSPALKIVPGTTAATKIPSGNPKEVLKNAKKYHVVKTGETLYSISKHYGFKVDEISRLNNLKEINNIQPGQRLLLSDSSTR